MNIPKEFLENFKTNDKNIIRISLLNYLRINRVEDFKICLEYCKKNNLDIIEKNNNFFFNMDKNEWTEKYLGDLYFELKYNFSNEKIKHILDVKESLNTQQKVNENKIKTREISKKIIDGNNVLIGAGIVTAVIGLLTVKPLVIGTGVILGGFGTIRKFNSNN